MVMLRNSQDLFKDHDLVQYIKKVHCDLNHETHMLLAINEKQSCPDLNQSPIVA